MKSILFLTYYFPPCNATGANRPGSFTRNLVRHGFSVTVITRQWNGDEKTWSDQIGSCERALDVKNEHNLKVHSLPYKRYNYSLAGSTFWESLRGNFNYELQYNQFTNYIEELISEKRFDYIMVSTPPLTTVKVGAMMAKKFGIPLIVDVRDFENEILLYKERNYSWSRWQQHKLLMKYFKKWMKEAEIIFTASPPLSEYIQKATGKEVFTLNNGFDEELLQINESPFSDRLHITVTGSLWEMANLPVMVETCRLIYDRNPGINIQFNFIGILINENVANLFRAVIPESHIRVTHRIPQQEALRIASSSHVLMLAGFDDLKGAYTTKVFEYLGLRRNILQIPGDNDVVEALIAETCSGLTPHTAEEAYDAILHWYGEWKATGSLKYRGKMEEIYKWSREKQFEKLLSRMQHVSL